MKIEFEISDQSGSLIEQSAERGIWGKDVSQVVARIVDKALLDFVDRPR